MLCTRIKTAVIMEAKGYGQHLNWCPGSPQHERRSIINNVPNEPVRCTRNVIASFSAVGLP